MRKQLDRLRPVWDRLRRWPRWAWAVVGVVVLFLGVVFFAAYDGRRVNSPVALEEVKRPDDVKELAALLARLEQLKNWQPTAADPNRLALVARYANLPAHQSYTAFSDLLRTTPGDEPTLNDSLELLSRPATNHLLGKLRQNDPKAFAAALQQAIVPTVEADREEAYARLLDQEKSQKLIRRLEIVGPAGEPGQLGRMWRSTIGQSRTNRVEWVMELIESGRHVTRLLDWYARLERTTELPVSADEQGAGLWFVRHPESGIEYDGFRSALNGELQLRVPAGGTALRHINTGVELNGVQLEPPPPGPLAPAPLRAKAWPAPTVAPDQLARALGQLGLPDGFSYSNIKCTSDQGRYTVTFTATSRVLDDCRFDGSWAVGGKTLDEVKQGLHGLPATARSQFERALAKAVRFGDWAVRFVPTKDDYWQAKVPLGADELSFSVRADDQCRLRWYGMPAGPDATAVAKLVAGSDERLAKLSPLVALESAHMNETVMYGTLRVKSPRPDQPSLTGVKWSLTPNGVARVVLSAEAVAFLDSSHQQIPKATAVRPLTPEQAREAILAVLKGDYPAIAPSVSVTDVQLLDGVSWVRVSMAVGDWPALDLGSYPVAARPDSRDALARAFSRSNVSAEVGRRWSEQHPRLGKVKVEFSEFEPDRGVLSLTVSTALALTSKSLSWPERWSAAAGVWSSQATEEWINRELEPQLATLEEGINAALQLAAGTTCRMKLRVNRNAFGLGRWLKLAPLSISLDGTLDLVQVPLGAEVNNVLIDGEGLHWPTEMEGHARFTIPAGPVALSDPSVRAILPRDAPDRLLKGEFGALGDITYMIGCKITPPSYGGKDVTGGQLRADNPWLHLIYLRAQVGGRLNNPKLTARGELFVLEQEVAEANFETALTRLEVQATLRTHGTRDGWLPQFNGELTITKDVPVRVGAETSICGVGFKGWLMYTTQDPPRIEGEMNGHVPIFGPFTFEAKSDVAFKDPQLIGYKPSAFWDGWTLKVTVTRQRIWHEYIKDTPKGRLVVRFEFPDASAIDEEKVKARLIEIEQLATPATAEELAWLTQPDQQAVIAPPTPPVPVREVPPPLALREAEPEDPKDPTDPTDPKDPKAVKPPPPKKRPVPIQFQENDLAREHKDDWFRLYTRSDDKTIVRLKNADAEITDHPQTFLLVAWYKDSKQVDLLTLDETRKRVTHVRCSDSTTVAAVTDWTDRLQALNLFPAGLTKAEEWLGQLARRQSVFDYAVNVWGETEPTVPVAKDGGYSFRYKSPDPKVPTDELFTWVNAGQICQMRFQSNYVPEAEQTSALRKLVAQTGGKGLHVLIAAEPVENKLAAVQFYQGKTALWPDMLRQPNLSIDLKLTLETSAPRLGQVGRRLVLPSWQTDKPLTPGTCHIAGEGGCLIADKQFWLLPRGECTNESTREPVLRLDREAFDKWDSETKRHLPKGWQDPAARVQVTDEQVAAQVAAGWAKQRRDEEWGAVPMGLFTRLAKQAREPAPASK